MSTPRNNKYFIDQTTFNCAFCAGSAVGYEVLTETPYDWSDEKKAYAYTVQCKKCKKVSLHLSYYQMDISYNRFLTIYDKAMRQSYVSHHEPVFDYWGGRCGAVIEPRETHTGRTIFLPLARAVNSQYE